MTNRDVSTETSDTTEQPQRSRFRPSIAAYVLIIAVALAGVGTSFLAEPLTPVVTTLFLGVAAGNLLPGLSGLDKAISFFLKRVLKFAIVLLGAGISFYAVAEVGGRILIAIALVITVALLVAVGIGRLASLDRTSSFLIGVGTAICGASAIAAVAPLIKARDTVIAGALGCIFTFNAMALVFYPIVGTLLGMDSAEYGAWVGLAVHDTAAVVAAGYAHGPESGDMATVVKLARTLFLIPLLIVVALLASRGESNSPKGSGVRAAFRAFPLFVLGFLLLAVLNGAGLLGGAGPVLSSTGQYLIVAVVAAVGLSLKWSKLRGVGPKMFLVGGVSSIVVGGVALVAIMA